MLPKDFPPWPTVYWWFRHFVRRLMFQTIHDVAVMLDRERAGREASPSGGVLDRQPVKAPAAATRGYDAAKKIVGRKRHIAVDTDGRLLMVHLTPANISDSAGAQMILDAIRKRWPWPKHLFADGAYDRGKLMDKAAFRDFTVEIVRRLDAKPGFKVLPRRWLGCGTDLRLDDPLSSPRPRLRTPDRRLRGLHLRRNGQHPAPQASSMIRSQTGS
jgi:putative transposase